MLARVDDTGLDTGPHKGAAASGFARSRARSSRSTELIRFVVAPDGAVVPTLSENCRAAGCGSRRRARRLPKRRVAKSFAKGFKREVRVPSDLAAATEQAARTRGARFARDRGKAGQVVAGFAKVETAIARERIAAILHARDGAADGIRKLECRLAQPARSG